MEHLPECEWNDETRVNRRCICPALRACEQRVTRSKERVIQEADYNYRRGVQAARDAVDAEAQARHVDGPTMFITLSQALAAIDALRLNTADCLCPLPNPDCQHPTCPREGK